MVAPASYGWSLALTEAVPDLGTVDVPAHDINDNVDQDSAQLAVDGDVISEFECAFAFDVPGKKVTVTNQTGEEWEAQSNLYVSAQRKPVTGAGIGGGGEDLTPRVEALETQLADLTPRVTTLEAQVADLSGQLDDHEARISALETPAARKR
jgi:hypothetical protein